MEKMIDKYGCSGLGFLIDCHKPNVNISWLHVSAMECTASENKEAEPVNNQPMVLTTALVALLKKIQSFLRKIEQDLT